jgi:adenosine kinase
MVAVGKHAAESGKVYMLNLSAPFVCQFFKDPMHRVLPFADFVFGNESEARAYGDANDMPGLTLEEIALRIAALPKVCARTRVSAGCTALANPPPPPFSLTRSPTLTRMNAPSPNS